MNKLLEIPGVEVYITGGYVRDRLLGLEGKDHDFVVTGATPEQMFEAGFQQVGKDFPVFLHPLSGDEFALARTERKIGLGHQGFETDFNISVTLEEDLTRRDLTINSMARKVVAFDVKGHAILDDEIIDPFNGRAHLRKGVIQHTSNAFVEDPLRVLRAARFASRFGFDIAASTMSLMEELINGPEFATLSQERIWAEIDKAMGDTTCKNPMIFWNVLRQIGGFVVLRVPFDTKSECVNLLPRFDNTANRMSLLLSRLPSGVITEWLVEMKAPMEVNSICCDVADASQHLDRFNRRGLNSKDVFAILHMTSALRNPIRFQDKIAPNLKRLGWLVSTDILLECLDEALLVTFNNLTKDEQLTLRGPEIKQRLMEIQQKRMLAIVGK
jgi:tRNA nucleotidyltransferase (CCA-adding enzyme)